jgi:predicted nucleic acid-binding protein
VAGQADVIVSGDEDLLVLHPFEGIPVLTPADFLEILDAERR